MRIEDLWCGEIERYDTHIILKPKNYVSRDQENKVSILEDLKEYIIEVKPYMLKKSDANFDFMARMNNDVPMPLKIMIGTVERETKGMVYMKLHGDVVADIIPHCLKCGKALTHPVSKYFSMGPECSGHRYINPFESDDELQKAVSEYRSELRNMTWEGWIIKSAIITQKENI